MVSSDAMLGAMLGTRRTRISPSVREEVTISRGAAARVVDDGMEVVVRTSTDVYSTVADEIAVERRVPVVSLLMLLPCLWWQIEGC